jgi:SAM-dependent methyltransferase
MNGDAGPSGYAGPSRYAEQFDALYRERPDPWDVRGSWYERRKLALVLGALPRERYAHALEIGCSVGATTEALAPRCDRLLALDASAQALALAAPALREHPGVRLLHASVPAELPVGRFDLVVLGEVGYFLTPDDLAALVAALPDRLTPGGHLLAVHWRRDGQTLPSSGDGVHEALDALGLPRAVHHVEEDFRLDVWESS